MKIYELQEVEYFFSPVMNKFFPKDSSKTIVAFKTKKAAMESVREMNVKRLKEICKEDKVCKYIPDLENLTKFQQEYVKSNAIVLDDDFISRMKNKMLENFMIAFNLNFYAINEVELK